MSNIRVSMVDRVGWLCGSAKLLTLKYRSSQNLQVGERVWEWMEIVNIINNCTILGEQSYMLTEMHTISM